MQIKRFAAATTVAMMSFTGIAALAAPANAADPTTTTPTDENACVNGHWPADTLGRPASLASGSAAGAYVWHNADGWHLFVTHPGTDKVVFSGRVLSSGKIDGVGRRTEQRDKVNVSKRDKVVSFRFTNFGHLDGIDFRTRCAQRLGFELRMNGKRIAPEQVFIGADAHHPAHTPFAVTRVV